MAYCLVMNSFGKSVALLWILMSLSIAVCAQNQIKPTAPEASSVTKDDKKVSSLELQETLHILYYKPMYFAYGNPLTKIQLSFRVSLFEEFPLNFGYSQIIFWQLGEGSKPFLDATYNPEFFYRMQLDSSWLCFLDFGIWEHHSYGKGDND